ncbi:hypothetical protein TYRP_009865 [Tyrophagus putrescentiae]|nr:hypothetical protein TYRP_009865 [Tyrophagus putrescentiae]
MPDWSMSVSLVLLLVVMRAIANYCSPQRRVAMRSKPKRLLLWWRWWSRLVKVVDRFQPKANLTAYELYWCELVEQSHVPVLTHPSNVLSVQPSVSFALSARGLTPITATCTLDNFSPSRVSEYRVVFYNGDANSAADSRQYHLGTYHVRLNAEEEFIPDSAQPEVTVHGRRFTFPVFEVTIDRRFSNNIVYYCALELGAPGTTGGLKYKSNIVHG